MGGRLLCRSPREYSPDIRLGSLRAFDSPLRAFHSRIGCYRPLGNRNAHAMDSSAGGHSPFRLLGQRRFAPFFWTQFCGAANDNVFKFSFTLLVTYQAVAGAGGVALDASTAANL